MLECSASLVGWHRGVCRGRPFGGLVQKCSGVARMTECVCCRHSGVRSAGASCGNGPLVRGDCVRSAERLDVVCRSGAVHCFAVDCGVALVSLGVAECGWSIVSAADMGGLRGE